MSSDLYTKSVADISKYTDKVDEDLVQAMCKTYALVMSKKDSSGVACTAADELATVKTNFLKKKLGLTDDAAMDDAIQAVCKEMSAARFKSRITFYYLLTKKFSKESVFIK